MTERKLGGAGREGGWEGESEGERECVCVSVCLREGAD